MMRGRLRLRVDAVKRHPALAAQLHEILTVVSGIRSVEVKARTGSVLLSYDPRALGSADFLDDFSAAMGTLFPAQFAPGRVSIGVDLLKGRPQLAEKIEQKIEPLEGIRRLKIDPTDGVCLVEYDAQVVTSPEFIDVVARSLAALLPKLNVKKILARTGLGRRS